MRVFVYGTLQPSGALYPTIEPYVHEFQSGRVLGYQLVVNDLVPFPGAVEADAENFVDGWLLTVDDMLLHHLDKIEGHPDFYRRRSVEVLTWDNVEATAWMYAFPTNPQGWQKSPDTAWRPDA